MSFERVGLLHVRMAGEQGIEAPVRVPLLVLQGGNDRVPHACHGLEGEAVGGDEPAGVDVGPEGDRSHPDPGLTPHPGQEVGEVRDHLDLTSAQRRGGILVGHRDKLRGGQPEALERGTVLGQQQAVRRSADPASREVAWLGDIGVGGYDASHRAALRHNGYKAGGDLGALGASGQVVGDARQAEVNLSGCDPEHVVRPPDGVEDFHIETVLGEQTARRPEVGEMITGESAGAIQAESDAPRHAVRPPSSAVPPPKTLT